MLAMEWEKFFFSCICFLVHRSPLGSSIFAIGEVNMITGCACLLLELAVKQVIASKGSHGGGCVLMGAPAAL